VWGRAGVGRSWLLRQVAAAYERRGSASVSISAPAPPLDEIGYGALRQTITQLAGWRDSADRHGVKSDSIRSALETVFAADLPVGIDPAGARAGASRALRWAAKLAVESSDPGKLVLLVDDLDQFDGASFVAVADLIVGEKIPGLTLICSASSALEDKLGPGILRQELRGWSRDLAVERLGEQRGLLQRSDDDIEPLYVEQLIASFEDDSWSAPVTLTEAVEQRLRMLPPDALCTLQALAVCGPSSIGVLSQMVERADDVNTSLLPLSELGLVSVSDGEARFSHEFIGRATLRLAPAGAIAAVHEKAAASAAEFGVGVELQAYHALRGRPGFEAFLMVEESTRLRRGRGDTHSAICVLEDGIEAARTLMLRDEDEMAKSGWLVFGRKLGALLREAGRLRDAAQVLSDTLDLTAASSSARAHMLEQLAGIAKSEGRAVENEILTREALRIADVVGEHTLALRLRGEARPPAPTRSATIPRSSHRQDTSQPRVLVVEDDFPLARALERWLRRRGTSPTICHSVAEAQALPGGFACGIFDVLLPDGSGLALAEQLMSERKVDAAVFFTSSEEASVAAVAGSLGALVRKSAGVLELEAVVDAALQSAARSSDRPSRASPANEASATEQVS
ncbi:MAG TPA: hypothetical protein PKA88_05620, partial [Polyangiaceae bacterium]|nr:hypothetical protein [Polyangiaceae bacterium]